MSRTRTTVIRTIVLTISVFGARQASAQLTLPYSGSCTSGGNCFAVTTSATNGTSVNAASTSNSQSWGVWGSSAGPGGFTQFNSAGVYGVATSTGSGVQGVSPGGGYGVYGYIFGNYSNTAAIYGNAATTGASYGVQGSSSYVGVQGTGNSYGVQGTSGGGTGVYGQSATSGAYGVEGSNTAGIGVYGKSSSGSGVYGGTDTGNGVQAWTGSSTNAAVYAQTGSASYLAFYGVGGIEITGSLAQKAGGGSWTAPSDRRIKKDIIPFDQGLAELIQVRPVRFKYNGLGGTSDNGKEYVGVVAQDLEKVLPSMVSSRKAKLYPRDAGETDIKQVDPSNFTYLLIRAVQEQQRIIERQEARLTDLEQGKPPMTSSMWTFGGVESAAAGFLLFGVFTLIRRRRERGSV